MQLESMMIYGNLLELFCLNGIGEFQCFFDMGHVHTHWNEMLDNKSMTCLFLVSVYTSLAVILIYSKQCH